MTIMTNINIYNQQVHQLKLSETIETIWYLTLVYPCWYTDVAKLWSYAMSNIEPRKLL